MFDPLDPKTWRDDPDDYVVPGHEMESVLRVAGADAEEEAQVRAFLGLDRFHMSEEEKAECLRQIMEGRRAIHDALRAMADAEDALAMTDEEMDREMRRRGEYWERRAGEGKV